MRQGLDKYPHRNGHVIKHKKDDFRVTELRFPNFRIRDFEPQEYSDKTDAIDDPRIPEDIKELATNYMDNLLKLDDDNDKPGAATQFFQSLAGPIV